MSTIYPEHTQVKGAVASDVTVQGNMPTNDTTAMTISAEGTAHIMSLLTDLYSDPNLAVLREYSTNALDSHKEAGQDAPIEVSLPSGLNPSFVVADRGVGMSAHEIRTIYSAYGASTKRNDFSQVGAFGLGCKAALTMTQQFTLNSVKNGQRTVAVISRGDDGVGRVNIVSTTKTDDPNGVTVTVPVADHYKFNANVDRFFRTWPKGSVQVDGREPVSIWDGDLYTTKTGYTHLVTGATRSNELFSVIMGGMAYPVRFSDIGVQVSYWTASNSDLLSRVASRLESSSISVLSEIPIGSIDLTPSREDIRYSDRTVKFLRGLFEQMTEDLPDFITKQISKATTRKEALDERHKWNGLAEAVRVAVKDITWNGETIPVEIGHDEHDDFEVAALSFGPQYRDNSRRKFKIDKNYEYDSSEPMPRANGTHVYIVAADATKRASLVRALVYWLDEASEKVSGFNRNYSHIYLMKMAPTSPWITDNEMFIRVYEDEIFETATRIRKEDRASAVKNATVLDYPVLEVGPQGKGTEFHRSVIQGDLTSKHYYIEADSIPTIDYIAKHKATSANQQSIALNKVLLDAGLVEGDHIIFIAKNRKLSALEKRTNLTFKSLYAALNRYRNNLGNTASDLTKAYTNFLHSPYSTEKDIIERIMQMTDVIDLLGDSHPFAVILIEVQTALDFSSKYATLTSVMPRLSFEVSDAETALKQRLIDTAAPYTLLRLADHYNSPLSSINPSRHAEHIADYINMVDGKE